MKLTWSDTGGCRTEGFTHWFIQTEHVREEPTYHWLDGLTYEERRVYEQHPEIELGWFAPFGGKRKVKSHAAALADLIIQDRSDSPQPPRKD